MIPHLPESLRSHADLISRADDPDTATALRWAADEIERLLAALKQIDDIAVAKKAGAARRMQEVARAALR